MRQQAGKYMSLSWNPRSILDDLEAEFDRLAGTRKALFAAGIRMRTKSMRGRCLRELGVEMRNVRVEHATHLDELSRVLGVR